jgi:hypothetical protein
MTMPGVVTCSRCGRRTQSTEGWNIDVKADPPGLLCLACQTAEENVTAKISPDREGGISAQSP